MNQISQRLASFLRWWRAKPTDEYGFQFSIENLLWTIGIIIIVGVVLTFLNTYIQSLLSQI
jgi:uncharacterized membrane protein affecting hemolysin expression